MNRLLAFLRRAVRASWRAIFPWARRIADLEVERDGLRAAYATRTAELEAGNAARVTVLEVERDGLKAAYTTRVTALEAHVAALTEASIDRERKLQEKQDLDYQVLMTHQHVLAGLKDVEPRFHALYERCKDYSMTSAERLYALYKSIEYIVAGDIPGDVAECGVWRGGSCMLMSLALLELGSTERRILMFDTFEGHPQPTADKDIDIWGNRGIDEWQAHVRNDERWAFVSVDEVRANLQATGYPVDRLMLIQGMVEETVPRHLPDQLAILRLDTDWYESTRVALLHLYPRLAPGGVLIIDDYGHYKGQREAVDEYFSAMGRRPLFHRIDYSCRVGVKR
jgi:O-methyltransferase